MKVDKYSPPLERKLTPSEAVYHSRVVNLFDLYRGLYEDEPEEYVLRSRDYVSVQLGEDGKPLYRTTILVATDDTGPIGFIQFGYRHCIVLGKVLLLNDLFVDPSSRNRGVGKALMEEAREYGNYAGALVVELETEIDNRSAQRLYESLGYERDPRYITYTRSVFNKTYGSIFR